MLSVGGSHTKGLEGITKGKRKNLLMDFLTKINSNIYINISSTNELLTTMELTQ